MIKRGVYAAGLSVIGHDMSLDVDSTIDHAENIIKNGGVIPDNIYEINVPDKSKCKVYNSEGNFIGIIIFDKILQRCKCYKNFNLAS